MVVIVQKYLKCYLKFYKNNHLFICRGQCNFPGMYGIANEDNGRIFDRNLEVGLLMGCLEQWYW